MAQILKSTCCQNSKCLTCQICDACQTYCQTSQKVSDHVKTFTDFFQVENNKLKSACLNSGQTIIIRAVDWNNLISFIKSGYQLGNVGTTTPPKLRTVEQNDPIYADDYNDIAKAFKLGSEALSTRVAKDNLIYGTYFTELKNYALKNFKLKEDQCASPDQCTKCNRCNRCDHEDTSYCCACNTKCDSGQTGKETT